MIAMLAASGIQPFSPNLITDVRAILHYDFMRYAALAGSVTAVTAGLVGYFVVLRQLTFASDALGDIAFPAALGALLLGIDLRIGLFVITILVALAMSAFGERIRGRDVAIGTVFAWVRGLGVLFLSLYALTRNGRNGSAGVSILFGSIFGLNRGQAVVAALVGIGVIGALLAIVRPLLLLSLLPDMAAARGLPVRALNAAFLVLVAITVAEAVPAIGSLLVFALIVTPAAIAHRVTARPAVALALSALLALAFLWTGLFVGFYTPYPVSFIITAIAFAAYVGVLILLPIHTRRRRQEAPLPPSRDSELLTTNTRA